MSNIKYKNLQVKPASQSNLQDKPTIQSISKSVKPPIQTYKSNHQVKPPSQSKIQVSFLVLIKIAEETK